MVEKRRYLWFPLCICTIMALVCGSGGFVVVMHPLQPSPASGPYDDEEFLRLANTTILSLSNRTVPNGTELFDLMSVQQKLSDMNVSPDLFQTAEHINEFLYYTGRAGYEYAEVKSLIEKPYSPVYDTSSMIREAAEYYRAAKRSWNHIQSLYPDVILYTMPSIDRNAIYSINEDETRIFPRGTPTSGFLT